MGKIRIKTEKAGKTGAAKTAKTKQPSAFQSSDPQQRIQKGIIENNPKVTAQRKGLERCFGPDRVAPAQKKENKTGIPDALKAGMEARHGADFSDVRVHPGSAKAPEVGALAYTQGNDIHFAPGQFSPETGGGKFLLGHELTHVVQQREGRVKATTEVAGMPVNDSPQLEKEADDFGKKTSDL